MRIAALVIAVLLALLGVVEAFGGVATGNLFAVLLGCVFGAVAMLLVWAARQ